ncbi:MAG: TonB-dependent receptor [Candidatus Symbiothrix sp.]|jgi:TonB-linked SusC/RagA family outer membrane protein|nr:TonB-dependent receptor [Candidatus Symbiothrix sp.]
MKKINLKSIIIILIAFFPIFGQAQVIKGKVLDKHSKAPLPGASLFLSADKSKGYITDSDGSFSLAVDSLPAKISVGYLGYQTQEINLKNTQFLTVELEENVDLLDEVVVIGYGTQRRRELTGAVSTISKEILNQKVTSLDEVLNGSVAGLNVTSVSGQPGAGSFIRIRGGNSINASNEPLYVIDGFIFFSEAGATQAGLSGIDSSLNPLAAINPADIESIEILKDVSAKAIYGSRGANGVILVTTKKGKRGHNNVNYQYSITTDRSAKTLDLLTAKQWLAIQKEYFNNKPALYHSPDELAQFDKGTDWQNAVLQTGGSQTHELSINGGDDKTRYLISGNYATQKGIILHSGFERFSGRLNLEKEVFSYLTTGVTVSVSRSTQDALLTFENTMYRDSPFSNGIANSLTYALYMPPIISIYDIDGKYNYVNPFEYNYLSYYGHSANPVSDLKNSIGQTLGTSLQGNFFAQITIIDELKARVSAGANVDYITQNYYAPPTSALGMNQDIRGSGAIGNRRTDVNQTETLLTYSRRLNPAHFVDFLAGYTNQATTTAYSVSRASHLAQFIDLAAGKEQPAMSRTRKAEFHSLLTRANYTCLERYNLTATYRADWSSRFAAGRRWGHFPSIGLSWNIDREAFLQSLAPLISAFKLRLTYGEAGNQEIDFNTYSLDYNYGSYNGETAAILTTLDNKDLKWETTSEYNLGVDAGFRNNIVSLTADAYYKKTKDLLSLVPALFGSGATQPQLKNVGSVTNKGVELAVNAKLIERKKLSWSFSANFARNINTITSLGANNRLTGNEGEMILRAGESVGSFYGYVFDGIVQNDEDISALPTVEGRVLKPGEVKFRNFDNDASNINKDDRVVLGSIQPDFTYGFTSSLKWKNFDFYLLFSGSQGSKVYNLLRRYLERSSDAYNMSAALLDSWTPSNPSNTVPHINSTKITRIDSRYVEDASYLKLRNITLAYTLSLKAKAIDVSARLFVSARNLCTITPYRGYDPEVASGIDLGVYPSARSFMAGISITL